MRFSEEPKVRCSGTRLSGRPLIRLGFLAFALVVLPGARGFLSCGGFGLTEDETSQESPTTDVPDNGGTLQKLTERMRIVEEGGSVSFGARSYNEFTGDDNNRVMRTWIDGKIYSETRWDASDGMVSLTDADLDGVIDDSLSVVHEGEVITTKKQWFRRSDGLPERETVEVLDWINKTRHLTEVIYTLYGGESQVESIRELDLPVGDEVTIFHDEGGRLVVEAVPNDTCPPKWKEGENGTFDTEPPANLPNRHKQFAAPGAPPFIVTEVRSIDGTNVKIATKEFLGVYCEPEDAEWMEKTFLKAWAKFQKCMCKYRPKSCGMLDVQLKKGLLLSCGEMIETSGGRSFPRHRIIVLPPTSRTGTRTMVHELAHVAYVDWFYEKNGDIHHSKYDAVNSCTSYCSCDSTMSSWEQYECYNALCASCAEHPDLCERSVDAVELRPCGPGAPHDDCETGTCHNDDGYATFAMGKTCAYRDNYYCNGKKNFGSIDRFDCTWECPPAACNYDGPPYLCKLSPDWDPEYPRWTSPSTKKHKVCWQRPLCADE